MKIISVEHTDSGSNFDNSRIFIEDGGVKIVDVDNSTLSETLKSRFMNDVDKFKAANDFFNAKMFAVDSKVKPDLNSRTEAYFYIVNHFDSSWSKSPYSNSYYNSNDIDWNHKPENSLRISDHWNFESGDEMHCETTDPTFTKGWALGQYINGKYEILKKF